MINLIVAIAENGVIGNGNALPWPRIDEDMAWFRKHTKGHAVAMGRKTWDSLPSRPLPSRQNYVISRSHPKEWTVESEGMYGRLGTDFLPKLNAYWRGDRQCFIIGGAEIYRQTLDIVDTILLTNVYGEYEGDTYLTEIALVLGDFHLTYEEEVPGKCKFEIWKRDNGPKI